MTSHVTFTDVTGPLDFTFGDYKVLPETPPSASANMSAVPVPRPRPVSSRRRLQHRELQQRRRNATAKAALAIRQVLHSPDVIGTSRSSNLAALQALAAQVNDDAAAMRSRLRGAAHSGAGNGGTQHVGFLVKTSRVQIDGVTQEELRGCNGQPATCNPFIDPQTASRHRSTIVRRWCCGRRSMPGREPAPDHRRRQSPALVHRHRAGHRRGSARPRQAQGAGGALAELLQELQTDNPGTPVISVGDYNAYQFNDGYTDPIAIIKGHADRRRSRWWSMRAPISSIRISST